VGRHDDRSSAAKAFGATPPGWAKDGWGEGYNTLDLVLTDPAVIFEGIGQQWSDMLDQKGVAYTIGYLVPYIVPLILGAGEADGAEAADGVEGLDDTGTAAGEAGDLTGASEQASSRILAKNMADAGIEKPDYPCAAHHIVAGSDTRATEAREILDKFGIGINDADNGVYLPTTKDVGGTYHPGLNTKTYNETVTSMLEKATTRDEAIDILKDVSRELSKGTFPYK